MKAREGSVIVGGLVGARKIRMARPLAHEPVEKPKALCNPLGDVGARLPRTNIFEHGMSHASESRPVPAQLGPQLDQKRPIFGLEFGAQNQKSV